MDRKMQKSSLSFLKAYASKDKIQVLREFRHHGNMSVYAHSVHVAKMACRMAERFGMDEERVKTIIVGAMLHDYFLYDWHGHRVRHEGIHAWSHPKIALRNADRDFSLTKKHKNIIRSHMFPTTLFHPPVCAEAWLVCWADKVCCVSEYASVIRRNRMKKYIAV